MHLYVVLGVFVVVILELFLYSRELIFSNVVTAGSCHRLMNNFCFLLLTLSWACPAGRDFAVPPLGGLWYFAESGLLVALVLLLFECDMKNSTYF